MKFQAYTFETVDSLSLSRVMEIYASCQWLSQAEKKAIDQAKRSRG